MSSATKEFTFSLKVVINKEETKVLFAEADSDFADVLLSFLTLPLGTIVRLLKQHYGDEAPNFGSLNTLYDSVTSLDNVHFWTEVGKRMLLHPRNSFEAECQKLKLNLDNSEPVKYFTCQYLDCSLVSSIDLYYDTGKWCSKCREPRTREVTRVSDTQTFDGNKVFTIKPLTFLIRDDLKLEPMFIGSITQSLSDFGVTDIDGSSLRTVTLGFNEMMDLLKGSLLSRTPLTDVILHKRDIDSVTTVKTEAPVLLHQIEKEVASKKMSIKVIMQKSTKKLLFARAEEDFIDFLFGFLTIPLGGVEYLLGSNTCLNNIDNLYRSTASLSKYLKNRNPGNSLLNPKIPPKYCSKNQYFPLIEQDTPTLYLHRFQYTRSSCSLSSISNISSNEKLVCFIDPKGQGSYVRSPQVYMVTDDLMVSPFCLSSSITLLKSKKIPLSDVKELEINIGMEEDTLCLEYTESFPYINFCFDKWPHSLLNETTKAGKMSFLSVASNFFGNSRHHVSWYLSKRLYLSAYILMR